jgi:hypothetical protein
MSRSRLAKAFLLAAVCSLVPSVVIAAGQRLRRGDSIGVFYVTKVAGAKDDGVEVGQDLCYRCRYGSSPMVIVFVRDTGGRVPELVRQLDHAVDMHEESSFKSLVTLIGEDAAQLKEAACRIAELADVKRVPIVVAKETQTGPLNYKLPDESAVTVVIAKDSQVVATHVFSADSIDVAAVMNDVRQMLN